MEHAWCRDLSRDERVRAAEDGRTSPLPTLGECIETAFSAGVRDSFRKVEEAWAMIPKSVSASSPVDQENKGDGMATERVTLEERITLEFSFDHRSNFRPKEWAATFLPGAVCQGISVRVVEDEERQEPPTTKTATTENDYVPPAPVSRPAVTRQTQPERVGGGWWFPKYDKPSAPPPPPPAPPRVHRGSGVFDANGDEVPWEGVVAILTAERDAAIRERDRWCAQSVVHERAANAAQARVAEMEAQLKILDDGQPTAPSDLGIWGTAKELSARCQELAARLVCVSTRATAAEARVAELEAASGGGEGQPVAWGVVRGGNVDSVTHRRFRGDADRVAEQWGETVVPLYRSPPQPRGWLTASDRQELEEIVVCLDDDNWQHSAAFVRSLLARSTPPKVRLPDPVGETKSHGPLLRKRDVLAALAAAGVEVVDA